MSNFCSSQCCCYSVPHRRLVGKRNLVELHHARTFIFCMLSIISTQNSKRSSQIPLSFLSSNKAAVSPLRKGNYHRCRQQTGGRMHYASRRIATRCSHIILRRQACIISRCAIHSETRIHPVPPSPTLRTTPIPCARAHGFRPLAYLLSA